MCASNSSQKTHIAWPFRSRRKCINPDNHRTSLNDPTYISIALSARPWLHNLDYKLQIDVLGVKNFSLPSAESLWVTRAFPLHWKFDKEQITEVTFNKVSQAWLSHVFEGTITQRKWEASISMLCAFTLFDYWGGGCYSWPRFWLEDFLVRCTGDDYVVQNTAWERRFVRNVSGLHYCSFTGIHNKLYNSGFRNLIRWCNTYRNTETGSGETMGNPAKFSVFHIIFRHRQAFCYVQRIVPWTWNMTAFFFFLHCMHTIPHCYEAFYNTYPSTNKTGNSARQTSNVSYIYFILHSFITTPFAINVKRMRNSAVFF